jgi:DeoR/GlpR family transcriptional regulator of sugar metabolism
VDVIDTIVTDAAAPADIVKALRKKKIEVIIAGK